MRPLEKSSMTHLEYLKELRDALVESRRKEVRSIIDTANQNDVHSRNYSAAPMIRLKAEIEAIDHAISDEEKLVGFED
jgi:hypothetical protein